MSELPATPRGRPADEGPEGSAAPGEDRGLDLLCGGLTEAEQQDLKRALAQDPAAHAEHQRLERLVVAARGLGADPVEAGLAQRIALRVRDRIASEEEAQRRSSRSAVGRWGLRTRVRILLASLAVHVLVLGWLVLRDPPGPLSSSGNPVEVAVSGPLVREPQEPSELLEPLDLGPIVRADEIPDSLLVSLGLGGSVLGGGVDASESASAWPANLRVAEHPEPVQFEMLARSRAGVRTQRLARLGLEPQDTLGAVARGLRALTERQRDDGSFPLDLTVPAERRPALSTLGMSALALLPFLAEGRRSAALAGEASDPVVARGIGWLQSALRVALDRAGAGVAPEGLAADDLALAVVALSEDYMLSYGRLAPAETAARGHELRDLVARLSVLQRLDGSFPSAASEAGAESGAGIVLLETQHSTFPLWPLLALDAVGHTGLALGSPEVGERLARWYHGQPRTPEGLPADRAGRPDPVLAAAEVLSARLPGEAARLEGARHAAGSLASATRLLGDATRLTEAATLDASAGMLATSLALYRADSSGFRTWNRAAADTLRRRLGPTGAVLRGDPIADTALTLLALQAAYRLY